MNKVLFVDTWSHGRFFTDDVSTELLKNFEVNYLHADSFYGVSDSYSKSSVYKNIYDLAVFDMSFVKALKCIEPDIVIFISMHGMFHRWLNLVCARAGIKTLFYMHGVRFVRAAKPSNSVSHNKNLYKNISRAVFYLKHWYLLGKDLMRSGPIMHKKKYSIFLLARSFVEMFTNNRRFSDNPKFKWGLDYDVICLNTIYDKGYFSQFVGKDNLNKAIVSGHLTSRRSAIESVDLPRKKKEQFLFISQPLVSAGYISSEKYLDIILKIKVKIETVGTGVLIVRPHPRDDLSFITTLKIKGVTISKTKSFAEDLSKTKAVFGFNSSALLGCMDIGLPVAVIDYNNIPLLEALKSYELSIELNLQDETSDWANNLSEWIKNNNTKPLKLFKPEPSEKIISNEVFKLLNSRELN